MSIPFGPFGTASNRHVLGNFCGYQRIVSLVFRRGRFGEMADLVFQGICLFNQVPKVPKGNSASVSEHRKLLVLPQNTNGLVIPLCFQNYSLKHQYNFSPWKNAAKTSAFDVKSKCMPLEPAFYKGLMRVLPKWWDLWRGKNSKAPRS